MVLPLFVWEFGFSNVLMMLVYVWGNGSLFLAYLIIWVFYFKKTDYEKGYGTCRYSYRHFSFEWFHIISLWNSRVPKDDEVYIIGDFCYTSGKSPDWYLRQLKGHKHLVIGNHDLATL